MVRSSAPSPYPAARRRDELKRHGDVIHLRPDSCRVVLTGRVRHASRPHTITIVAVTKGGALVTAAPMKVTLRR